MITAQQAREISLQDEYMSEIIDEINQRIVCASSSKLHWTSILIKKEYTELIVRKLGELGYLSRVSSANIITDLVIINW